MSTETTSDRAAELLTKIEKTEKELQTLKKELASISQGLHSEKPEAPPAINNWKWPLRLDEYERYGRQLIIPDFGVEG